MGWIKIGFLFYFPDTLVCLYGHAVFKGGRKIVHHGFIKIIKKPTLRRGLHCGFAINGQTGKAGLSIYAKTAL